MPGDVTLQYSSLPLSFLSRKPTTRHDYVNVTRQVTVFPTVPEETLCTTDGTILADYLDTERSEEPE